MSTDDSRKKILFVIEAVTLAHLVRSLVLAKGLDPARYDVHLAYADNDLTQGRDFLSRETRFTRWTISSISSAQFLQATASGSRLFDFPTLKVYAAEELQLFETVKPDLVVGDLRCSLLASAPTYGVTYAAIQNAYWSPQTTLDAFPLPEYTSVRMMMRLLGSRLTSSLIDLTLPLTFNYHLRPINRLRRQYGLPPFDHFLEAYTHSDHTLYSDLPELIPIRSLPGNHHYLGPIMWSPPVAPPAWWDRVPEDRPCVYVSLGSSGQTDIMPALLQALEKMPLTAMLATAGRFHLSSLPANVFAADYLPGDEAAQRSAFVICNGGSGAIYQAIQAGVPLLGIPSNMDQVLAMSHVEQQGCGILLRSGEATATTIMRAIEQLLGEERHREAARHLQQSFVRFNAPEVFAEFVSDLFSTSQENMAQRIRKPIS